LEDIKDLKFHLFADDTTIWSTGLDANNVGKVIQNGLDAILKWSDQYNMPISKGKTEAILFYHTGSSILPKIVMGPDEILYNQNDGKPVRLLGILLDHNLSFVHHINKLKKNVSYNLNLMREVSSSGWGPSTKDLIGIYVAFCRSRLEYCATVWAPFLTKSRKNTLEVLQNTAARIATGCVASTSIPQLLLVSNLLPIEKRHEIQSAIVAEKYRRLPDNNPLFKASTSYLPKSRLQRKQACWLGHGDSVLKSIGLNPRRLNKKGVATSMSKKEKDNCHYTIHNREMLLMHNSYEPWNTDKVTNIIFNTHCIRECSIHCENDIKKNVVEDTFLALGAFDFEAWTDASVKDKTGAGAGHLYNKESQLVSKVYSPSGHLSGSFRAEIIMIRDILLRIKNIFVTNDTSRIRLLVATDSQSAISALAKGPLNQRSYVNKSIWDCITYLINNGYCSNIVFQFVYSHCGVVKNELVDLDADLALKLLVKKQDDCLIHMDSIRAEIKSSVSKNWLSTLSIPNRTTLSSNIKFTDLEKFSCLPREDETLLLQLISGKCRSIGEFRKKILHDKWNGICRWCRLVDESVDHILCECQCEDLIILRKVTGIFEKNEILSKFPIQSLDFIKQATVLLNQEVCLDSICNSINNISMSILPVEPIQPVCNSQDKTATPLRTSARLLNRRLKLNEQQQTACSSRLHE
jgi:hypothetical protein